MTSAGRPFCSIDPFVLAAKAEIDEESKPNSGRIESRGSPTTRYGVKIVYSVMGSTQYGVACEFVHEIQVVFEVQEACRSSPS